MMQLQQESGAQQISFDVAARCNIYRGYINIYIYSITYTEGTLTYTYTVLHIQYDFVVPLQGKCEILGKIQNARKFWQRCAAQAFKPWPCFKTKIVHFATLFKVAEHSLVPIYVPVMWVVNIHWGVI